MIIGINASDQGTFEVLSNRNIEYRIAVNPNVPKKLLLFRLYFFPFLSI